MLDANNIEHNLRISGVTLTELMITVAIVTIVTTMAIPTFSTTIARGRITSYTNEFLSYLNYARNEAITRGRRVVICVKNNDETSCSNSGNWEEGFVVFVDVDNDQQMDTEEVLRVQNLKISNITISGDSKVVDYIAYSSDGRTRTHTGDFQDGILSICDANTGLKRAIEINKVGRARANEKCKFCPSNDPALGCNKCTATCP